MRVVSVMNRADNTAKDQQPIEKVTNILVLTQRQITVVQRIQETMESPQLQYTEKKADRIEQVPQSQVVRKTGNPRRPTHRESCESLLVIQRQVEDPEEC